MPAMGSPGKGGYLPGVYSGLASQQASRNSTLGAGSERVGIWLVKQISEGCYGWRDRRHDALGSSAGYKAAKLELRAGIDAAETYIA